MRAALYVWDTRLSWIKVEGEGGARGQVNISREGSKERRDLEGWLPRN